MVKTVKIYQKILRLFLLTVVPAVVFCVATYCFMLHKLNDVTVAEQRFKAQIMLENINGELERIKGQMQLAIISDDVQRAAYFKNEMSQFEYYKAISGVLEQLAVLSGISDYSDYARLYMYQNKNLVASDGFYDEEAESAFLDIAKNCSGGIVSIDGDVYLLQAESYISENNIPNAIIVVRLSRSKLKTAVKEFTMANGGNAELYIGDNLINDKTEDSRGVELSIAAGSDLKFIWNGADTIYKRKMSVTNLSFSMLTVVLICILIAFMIYVSKLINRPLVSLVDAFSAIEDGKFGYLISDTALDEFGYIYDSFNKMSTQLESEIANRIEQRVELQNAQFKELQAQINPHFMYNTLFLLKYLLNREKVESACDLCEYLGNYFRYTCHTKSGYVTVGEELEHIRNYLNIQKMRFGDGLDAETEAISEEAQSAIIPQLIIQPLVENAFKYVVDKKSMSLVRISVEKTEERLTIYVADNGNVTDEQIAEMNERLKSKDAGGRITATMNIDRRVKLKYGEKSGLTFSRSEFGGLLASIHIYCENGGIANV